MNVDDLKITIMRAAKPGDILFINVPDIANNEIRELVVALADYLRPTGIIPVMIPHSIKVVGTIVQAIDLQPPPAPAEPIPQVMAPILMTADDLSAAELAELIDWHEREVNNASQDDFIGARVHRMRAIELEKFYDRLAPNDEPRPTVMHEPLPMTESLLTDERIAGLLDFYTLSSKPNILNSGCKRMDEVRLALLELQKRRAVAATSTPSQTVDTQGPAWTQSTAVRDTDQSAD